MVGGLLTFFLVRRSVVAHSCDPRTWEGRRCDHDHLGEESSGRGLSRDLRPSAFIVPYHLHARRVGVRALATRRQGSAEHRRRSHRDRFGVHRDEHRSGYSGASLAPGCGSFLQPGCPAGLLLAPRCAAGVCRRLLACARERRACASTRGVCSTGPDRCGLPGTGMPSVERQNVQVPYPAVPGRSSVHLWKGHPVHQGGNRQYAVWRSGLVSRQLRNITARLTPASKRGSCSATGLSFW